MTTDRAIAELERSRANLLRVVTVAEADYAEARVRVTLDEGHTSAWLPWLTSRAGGDRTWAAPEVGEQVLIACPDGDPAQGVILGAIYQQQYAAPADSADITRTEYSDGAIIEYDRSSHALTATLPEGGTATIVGDLHVDGHITATKYVRADGEVSANGGNIRLTQHLHGGVKFGSELSGPPEQ